MLKRLVYRYYERQLENEVLRGRVPHHVGVVLDGNRRYAVKARSREGRRRSSLRRRQR